ncbi:serine/threonine-protein kinase haspin homolog [Drosophila teissieri]|uniref:serine/threonine-protein kinase haspin homolog n=1 Tax=Drosophila teissieri TaxID=7243 RepID=UPI001CBA457B|nr:serine/threonine-protein kinase haspin homolog [Drosophila teissieri]
MANFQFLNSEQSYYALLQIILALAVGEEEYQFEHRDLHLGNILIEYTNKKHIIFTFKNTNLTVLSKGVNMTIIDYTLSRITINSCCYFNDLSSDEELFQATGDYQYDVYRMMRNELKIKIRSREGTGENSLGRRQSREKRVVERQPREMETTDLVGKVGDKDFVSKEGRPIDLVSKVGDRDFVFKTNRRF